MFCIRLATARQKRRQAAGAVTTPARATGDAAPVSAPDWMPVWAMPNVTLDDPIETSQAALVTLHDERLRAIAERRPTIDTFLRAFRDEFGVEISPTVAILREGAQESVRTVAAFGGLRDAVCVSAIVAGHALDPEMEGASRFPLLRRFRRVSVVSKPAIRRAHCDVHPNAGRNALGEVVAAAIGASLG